MQAPRSVPSHQAGVPTKPAPAPCRTKGKFPLCTHVRRLLSVLCLTALSLTFTGPAAAVSLDEQLKFLLENGCANLGGTITGNLAAYCAGAGGSGTSAGGGASTPQTAPGIVQERLKEAGGETGSETGVVTELAPGLSLLLSTEYEKLDRDVTRFEAGYDSDILRFTVGVDYQFSDSFLAGLAFTYYQHDGDLASGGDFENNSYGLLGFAAFYPTETVFIQATLGYADKDYERNRTAFFEMGGKEAGPGPAKASYDGSEYSGGILIGSDHRAGELSFGPRLSLDWIYSDFDGYSEQGSTGLELVFADTSEFSLQSRLGMVTSMAISTGFGVLVPQLNADWVHELENDQRTENFSFVDDSDRVNYQFEDQPPDRDFFEVGAGISTILPNGWQLFAQYRTLLGHDYLDSHVGTLGLRFEF